MVQCGFLKRLFLYALYFYQFLFFQPFLLLVPVSLWILRSSFNRMTVNIL